MFDPIFISHGSPTLPFDNVEARAFLQTIGQGEPPRAILTVSAHWETAAPTVNAVAVNQTIHDFRGFPPALYQLRYAAPGDPALAHEVVGSLAEAGLACSIDERRGLDHGAWVPLLLAYPGADIPVVQLSVQPHADPAHHIALGRALQPLVASGVRIIASGSFTHDLSSFRQPLPLSEPEWVSGFADWMDAALTEGREADLVAFERLAPFAHRNHPTPEHILPLFVAFGAAGEGARGVRLHDSVTFGVLRMDAYAFRGAA